MSRAQNVRVVFVTAPSAEEAANIGRTLVEERLAACANIIGPIRSIYRWRENIEDSSECMIIMKTRRQLLSRLQSRVRELHSYEVPEIIAVELADGSAPYVDWVIESTSSPQGDASE